MEGDYWSHDYLRSPKNSEWPAGFQIGGDCWYCSVENVNVVDITGYGGQNGVAEDSKGWLTFFYESLPKFSPGGIDRKTGKIDTSDTFRFTTDFKDLSKITGKYGRRRLQISKLLGYQGIATRSWQMTVAWFDAGKNFISAETAWQYREMWIPENAAFLKLGAYTVGKICFDGCAVSGSQSLVDVFDMRSLSLPANTDPAKNPDRQPGTIEF